VNSPAGTEQKRLEKRYRNIVVLPRRFGNFTAIGLLSSWDPSSEISGVWLVTDSEVKYICLRNENPGAALVDVMRGNEDGYMEVGYRLLFELSGEAVARGYLGLLFRGDVVDEGAVKLCVTNSDNVITSVLCLAVWSPW